MLFRVLCSGVSMFMFGLCVKFMETCVTTVVLAAIVVVGLVCVQLVQSIVPVIEFSRAWRIVSISIGYVKLFTAVGKIRHVGRYSYR